MPKDIIQRKVPAGSAEPQGVELILGKSDVMQEVRDYILNIAPLKVAVLFTGESGTGKELAAMAVHYHSGKIGQFVHVNCAAIPRDLLESELFGYKSGAFTGASRNGKLGLFSAANNGTIFLDELHEMPLDLQSKLLVILQNQMFYRVGSTESSYTNARIVSAIGISLDQAVSQQKILPPLKYRLKVAQIILPPLRERGDDKLELTAYFLERYSREHERYITFDTSAWEFIGNYNFPGNVRELQHTIEAAIVKFGSKNPGHSVPITSNRLEMLVDDSTSNVSGIYSKPNLTDQGSGDVGQVTYEPVTTSGETQQGPTLKLADVYAFGLIEASRRVARKAEKEVLKQVLQDVLWNRVEAARRLKISYKSLLYRISDCGIGREVILSPSEQKERDIIASWLKESGGNATKAARAHPEMKKGTLRYNIIKYGLR